MACILRDGVDNQTCGVPIILEKPPEVQKAHMKEADVRQKFRNLRSNTIKQGVIKTEKLIDQRIKKTKSQITFL